MMGKKSGQKYDVALFSRDEEAYQRYLESIEDKFPKKFIKGTGRSNIPASIIFTISVFRVFQ